MVDALGRSALVPFSLIYAHHLSALHGDAAVGEEVRGIGEDHVELEVKFAHQPYAIALEEGEVTIGGFIIRMYHIYIKPLILHHLDYFLYKLKSSQFVQVYL